MALTDDQEAALRCLRDAGAVPEGGYRMQLYRLRDEPPYLDGRVLTGLVRRGLIARHELPPPFSEPSFTLTEAGVEAAEGLG